MDGRDGHLDVEDCENQPFVEKASPERRPFAKLFLGLAMSAALIAAAVFGGQASTAVSVPSALPALGLDLELPPEEQVNFYLFTHVGNPKMLPDVLEYPLEDLVNSDDSKGVAVMYVMEKHHFKTLLGHINEAAKDSKTPVPDELTKLHEDVQKHMKKANANMQPLNRIRILTPLDFKGAFLSVRRRVGEKDFAKWLGHTTYDAPKFAGALLRLRMLGNNIPVFRFDIDVLFNKYTKDDMSSIKTAVAHGVADVKTCTEDPEVQDFVVSQQYGAMKAERSSEFNAWNEAYSTRVNPGLLATAGTTNASQWKEDGGWGSYHPSPEALQEATNEELLLAFYGLKKVDGEDMLQPTTPSDAESAEERAKEDILKLGNAYIGANPSRAVISGAALALGPGASVDMPPFLHTDLNIMWIDDHLLDRLTQEVSGTKRKPRAEGVGTARVIKARSQPSNPAKYTLELYMPTLMYGILMDAWVNNHPSAYLLKFAPSDIPDNEALEKAYAELMTSEAQGPWSQALHRVRETGKMLPKAEVKDLKKKLWAASCERAKDVYWQWSQLPQPEVDGEKVASFATLWGTGRVCENKNLEAYCSNDGYNKLGQGLLKPSWDKKAKKSKSREELPDLHRNDFSPAFKKQVDNLVDAAVHHLEWTLLWPDVIQAVRNEQVGEVPSDVEYGNPPAIPQLGPQAAQ